MKYLIVAFAIALASISCTNQNDNKSSVKTNDSKQATTEFNGPKNINIETSNILWKGHKLLGYHTGSIKLQEGKLNFKNGELTSGTVIVDMSSIAVTKLMDEGQEEEDEEESPEDDRQDLADHLMESDFFDAKQFPIATFKIRKTTRTEKGYHIIGNMTIKDTTQEISFDAMSSGKTLTAEIKIDRTDFGIKYGSGSFIKGLGDNVIKDEFDLSLFLELQD